MAIVKKVIKYDQVAIEDAAELRTKLTGKSGRVVLTVLGEKIHSVEEKKKEDAKPRGPKKAKAAEAAEASA